MESLYDDYLIDVIKKEEYQCSQLTNPRDMRAMTDRAVEKASEVLNLLVNLDSFVSYEHTIDGQQHFEYMKYDRDEDDDVKRRAVILTDKQSPRVIYMRVYINRRPALYMLVFSSDAVRNH